uniref:Uncharacterized protein n=1 Tax=Nicotiana tabacum TaxID=4097 RepID=A0A1S4CSW0_TOBAC|nr:PREDICTED: uncharacterized protein LOC107822190 [Nicotiana tabacum]
MSAQESPIPETSPPFHCNTQGYATTSYAPPAPPPKQNPPPPVAPIFVAPAPAPLQRSSSEPFFQAHGGQYYPPEPTFRALEPYSYSPHFEIPEAVDKPAKNAEHEEVIRKFKSLEQSFRNMHGLGSQVSVAYKDRCPFPDVQLPAGFKMPKFDLYEGHGDPVAHLRGFCSKMRGAGGKDELLIAYFVPDRLSLLKFEKKPGESFREFGFRRREQTSRVDPPMRENETVDYFLQTLEPTYFEHLVTSVGKSFNEVLKMGAMIEEGLKSNKILSYLALKETTQAIQSRTSGVLGKKKKEEVATVETGTWSRCNNPPPYYSQPRPHSSNYPYTTYSPPQYYYPPPEPHFSVHHAQMYTQPPAHPQWRAPAPQNTYTPPQNTHLHPRANRPGPGFRPNQAFQNEKAPNRRNFTPLGNSYTAIFHRLKHMEILAPIEPKVPNPPPRNLDQSVSCEYCSGMLGHATEKCWKLKNVVQYLIDNHRIEVQAPEVPNNNQNPLLVHYETNMIELVHKDGEMQKPSQTVMMIRAVETSSKEKLTRIHSWVKLKGASDKPVIVIGKELFVIAKKLELAKLVVKGASSAPVAYVKGAYIEPVIIKLVVQLPVVDSKAVPWKYKKVVVTYKGKEIEEESCEVQRLTRSGRCFAPEELRKARATKDSPAQVKKAVTEEEAEEFLRKMKVQDYSIVEQLRKTPAHISLLSLLIHSDEHRRALMTILNEAHVPDKISVNHLETIATKMFEVNTIMFSDDELPIEGTTHNRGLYLTVKCEDSVVTRAFIDNGSSANIVPMSTLNKLKIDNDRIRRNNVCV